MYPPHNFGRAGDAVDCILRAGARRAFPTRGFAERLAARGWDLSEPPGEASAWVEELEAAVQGFRVRVAAAHGLSEAATAQAQPGPLCISWPDFSQDASRYRVMVALVNM